MSLDNTLEKIGGLHPSLRIQVGEAEGWHTFEDIWQTELLDYLLGRLANRYQFYDKHFLALTLLNLYSWMPLAGGVGAYFLDGRMLDLHPSNLLWHFDAEGNIEGLALRGSRLYEHSDPAVLREQYHNDIRAHMQVILNVLCAKCGIGKPALWAVIEDRIGGLVLYALGLFGQLTNCEEEAQAWAKIQQPVKSIKKQVIWIDYEEDNRRPFWMRSACCLSYKLPQYGYCATCPLLSREECEKRLRETPA